MKIAAYEDPARGGDWLRHGVVVDEMLHPLPAGTSLLELLAASPDQDELLGRCEQPVRWEEVRLGPPLQPASIRDFITFERHYEGTALLTGGGVPDAWYEAPAFYFTNPYAVLGAGDEVPVPPGCGLFDFELEVAAVIGRDGFNLTVEEAVDHIVGYTILNDWSARDLQGREMQVGLGPAKGKDTATTLGPWLVTPDELDPYRRGDRYELAMTAQVNGEVIGSDVLSSAAWSFPELVAYASRGTVVKAGDVLGSGTCQGGCLAELWGRNGALTPPPLAVGDVVTLTVEGIGTISNTVVEGPPVHPVPAARRLTEQAADATTGKGA
ncbi:fumarylacetoacetate hydrolase family protein [Streptomyces krungchingensis]